MTNTVTTYDVVVAGGGPAGAATALRLARAGHSVALLERSRFDRPRVGETLAPSIQPLLRDLGVWERFVALGPLPSWGTRSIWSSTEPAAHSHLESGYDSGWHVDRRLFDRMLFDAAAEAGASVSLGTSLIDSRYDGTWQLTCSNGRRITGRVLIDATGRSATVGRSLGARRIAFDRLVGITAQWSGVDVTAEQYLLIESVADGWWYTAPLPGNVMVGMFMTDADICRRDNLTASAPWRSHLQSTTATALRVDGARLPTTPRVYSAASHRLVRQGDTRPWLAVGDAALAVDPISGSGVPRALRTAEAAATTVAHLLTHPADATPLTSYESTRNTECTTYLSTRADYYDVALPHPTPFWTRRKLQHDAQACSVGR
ncbi:flavin-dependent dehydrogenase [Kribbella sp. VKM Ac-2569]|uniref:NAD(P)/FAD-dependent oxidoreductase n=1 Tax=Kribbella sp. VKM Ac-2569 TaxID=2512220 RepID=UPI00102CC56B|nr:FAD-dependent oxidoreductase [Kribbella sp. VKM Ac-2569]RZT16606.1 flavin-dependent dehydrogenase [Kribbella sp. VKM Ac-2569]